MEYTIFWFVDGFFYLIYSLKIIKIIFFKKKKKKEKRKNDFMVFVHYLFVATHFGACTGVTAEAIVLPSNHLD